jgi:hypothetical protein
MLILFIILLKNKFNLKFKVMKKHILLFIVGLLSLGCNSQDNEAKKTDNKTIEKPKGSWKVDKQFDENGNLISYDSIYSWSSSNKYDNLTAVDKDSIMKSFKSKFFTNFSQFENEGFEDIFSQDSLFSDHFFNDNFFGSPFGQDFIDVDKMRQQMIEKQKMKTDFFKL